MLKSDFNQIKRYLCSFKSTLHIHDTSHEFVTTVSNILCWSLYHVGDCIKTATPGLQTPSLPPGLQTPSLTPGPAGPVFTIGS